MKIQTNLKLLATIAGGILFNFLFWKEDQALNLCLYSLFILVIVALDKSASRNRNTYLAAGAHLFSAMMVVINQSDLTILTWYISLAIFTGILHFPLLRSIYTMLLAAFLQLATAPFNFIKGVAEANIGRFSLKPVLKPIKYIVIPFIALLLFSTIYSVANPLFAKYLDDFNTFLGTGFLNFFNFFFSDLSFLRFLHVLLGIFFTAAVLIGLKNNRLEKAELNSTETLQRRQKRGAFQTLIYDAMAVFAESLLTKKMALKTENITGIISFAGLNMLLLFLNSLDIATLWFGTTGVAHGLDLSAELHTGTNALILSIVMAMTVILYFFKGNLNFYSRNKTIRLLAYIWIAQNLFLVSSVFFRDYLYIDSHGLTYKRIGVLVFLMLCTIGLTTVYLKVAKRKTFFYLCKVNGLFWYLLLLVAGLVNWDVFIVRYNISNRDSIALDFDHVISLSDKTLPVLLQNKEVLKSHLSASAGAAHLNFLPDSLTSSSTDKNQIAIEEFQNYLSNRIEKFKQRDGRTSWLSWNYRDWETNSYLKDNGL